MSKILNFHFEKKNKLHRVFTIKSNEKDINNGSFSDVSFQLLITEKYGNRYEMMGGYEASDEGLKKYSVDFYKSNGEIFAQKKLNNMGIKEINAFSFSCNNKFHVVRTFKQLCNEDVYILKETKGNNIEDIESYYFEHCFNGGLINCDNGTYECYGYDHKKFYPMILGSVKYSDFKIPIREGRCVKLETLDKTNIKFGFYNVKITCTSIIFNKLFKYSRKHIYTQYSLLFAFKHQEEFNVKIDLLQDVDAYLYDDKDVVDSRSIFGTWYDKLMVLAEKYPKNKLVKHMMSSLWGYLSEKKKYCVPIEELNNRKDWGLETDLHKEYYLSDYCEDVGNTYATLKKRNNKYLYDIRLKPFLLSYARNVLADIAYNNHPEEIVRMYIDNIVYKSNVKFDVTDMVREEKTSGLITWKNNHQVDLDLLTKDRKIKLTEEPEN